MKGNIKDLEQFAKSTKDATEESIVNSGSELVMKGEEVKRNLQNTIEEKSNDISIKAMRGINSATNSVVGGIDNVAASISSANSSLQSQSTSMNGGGRRTRRRKSRKMRKTKNKKQRKKKTRRRGRKMHKKRRTMRKK